MLFTVAVVFLAVFALTALVLVALGAGGSPELKETMARLDSISAGSRLAGENELTIIKREELLSSLPQLDRWLRKVDPLAKLRPLLIQADVKWTAGRLVINSMTCGAAVAAVVYLRTRAVFPSLVAGAAGACGPILYVLRKRKKRFNAFEEMLPEALDLIVSALRAGHGLTSAIGTVGKEMTDPVAREFRQCFDEQNFGLELRTALLNLAGRMPIQDVRIVVTAILVQKESGGNLAEVLDKVAAITRERFKLKRQIRVHTAQGRLTGWILAVLPIVLGFGLYLANPDGMSLLWHRPLGLKLLYGASIMTAIGGLVIRKIVRVRV